MPWWILVPLIWFGAALLALGICGMAVRFGDRRLARARRDLAGPPERDRLGL